MCSYTVLGAGGWGPTLAQVLALKGSSVKLWAREAEVRESITRHRENSLFLPGVRLSEKITPFGSLKDALEGAVLIVSVVPSHGLRDVLIEAREHLRQGRINVRAKTG